MKQKLKKSLKLLIGLLISAVFMYLAFRKVDFQQMWDAFKGANYWYIFPSIAAMFISYWLRAFRWHYLMAPVKRIETRSLFSALLIGYMGNSFLPAHLGEFIRAYVIGKKKDISGATVMASIIVERILDVLALLILMGVTILVFPFPDWVRKSGYLFLIAVLVLALLMIGLKKYPEKSGRLVARFTRFLPGGLGEKIDAAFQSLIEGIMPLIKRNHYLKVFILTALIWFCYAAALYIVFFCFDFVAKYHLTWMASLVLLVMTTIGILVPSSPGYIGVYHFLCQVSLGFFAVPKGEALTYAFVLHGINFFPIIVVGLILVFVTNVNIRNFRKEQAV